MSSLSGYLRLLLKALIVNMDSGDSQVFKSGSDKLDYQLEAVYSNGVREVIRTESLNYTSTAVRRTWGSLKGDVFSRVGLTPGH